jgi:hypothetical protein
MATLHPHALRSTAATPAGRGDIEARARRWCVLAIAVMVLLAAYAGGVTWVTHQLEASVDRSLQPLPALVRDQPQP